MLIKDLNIKSLLTGKDFYEIPVYQRNFAWRANEIEQLIEDVTDFAVMHSDKNYYIGTLVVAKKQQNGIPYYETVDGQQRLTTLSILSAAIRNSQPDVNMEWLAEPNLRYASRKRSQQSMKAVYDGIFKETADESEESRYDLNIQQAYQICVRELPQKVHDKGLSIKDFAEYLYENVVIMRVQLPEKIDLNHYFEIMNSRGEQLEKHEILKAQLMEKLSQSDLDVETFNLVWEACANMEKYVQYGFTAKQRDLVFGKDAWNRLTVLGFDELAERIKPTLNFEGKGSEMSIDDILSAKTLDLQEEEKDDSPDRFNTVINFPNFLLHVLRVQTQDSQVTLDDKQLLNVFAAKMADTDASAFAKEFCFNLLKCKFLFDQYIIKREFTGNTDRWSLKKLKWYSKSSGTGGFGGYVGTFSDTETDNIESEGRRILMLLSAFHVSIPSMVYKHWLSAALNYLFNASEVLPMDYIGYLEHIAKSFVFDRYLQNEGLEFYPMIFENLDPVKRDENKINWNKLRYGQLANNFVFNFTDYLIWVRDRNEIEPIRNYEFTSRSSVEHFYPQNPFSAGVPPLNEKVLHSFGNLCLISHEKNSRLSNFSAESKKKEFYNKGLAIDSPKQYLMMRENQWGTDQINAHNEAMIALLKANMDSGYRQNLTETKASRWFREYRFNHPALLSRALLGFADYTTNETSNRCQLFHFDSARRHEAFRGFESYVDHYNPKTLQAVIDHHASSDELKNDWRYLFVRYPKVYEHAQKGFITWQESPPANWQIELLHGEKRTKNTTEELLLFLLREHLAQLQIELKSWEYSHYFDIDFGSGSYQPARKNTKGNLYLKFWSKAGGTMILYELHSNVHGNHRAVKYLNEYGWEYKDGNYSIEGKKQLVKLTGNASLDLENLIVNFKRLLKKGFGIKI